MIPKLINGRLPSGRWPATMAELYVHFVNNAPNRDRRMMIFTAFSLYAKLIAEISPDVRLWVDGGFVTHKEEAPKDIDVVAILPADAQVTIDQVKSLLTFSPAVGMANQLRIETTRLQPIGGLVDSFVVSNQDTAALDYWDDWWSSDRNDVSVRKGYLEVVL